MQETYEFEQLYSAPQVLSPEFGPIGSVRIQLLRWQRGEIAPTGDAHSPIFCNRVYVLDGNEYREQPTHTIRSRFSFLSGRACHSLALAAREDVTKIRVTLDSDELTESGTGGTMTEFGVFQIRKDPAESGGSFSPPDTWIVRPLNFVSSPFGQLDTFGRLQLDAGHYALEGWTTGMENGRMRARFRSLDNAILWPSASTYSLHYSWHIPIHGVFTIPSPTTFLLEMRCSRNRSKSWGFGYTSETTPDIYASLMFHRQNV